MSTRCSFSFCRTGAWWRPHPEGGSRRAVSEARRRQTGSSGAGTRVASRSTGPRKLTLTGIQQRAERVVRACPRGRPPRERRLHEHDESPVDRVDGRCRQCPRKPTEAAPRAYTRVARPRREIELSAATRAHLATPDRARPRAPRACTGTASHRMLVHVADTAPRHRSSAPSSLPCGPLVRAEARACHAAASMLSGKRTRV